MRTLFDEQATKAAIHSEIQWLTDNADDNDVSLFYFVGHGSSVSATAFIHAADTVIVDEELAVFMENISGSLIIILDSCYSGGFIEELERVNRTILTACAKDERTYQVHDLNAGMFGFFLNASLAWCTKNIESTYILTKLMTHIYGNMISKKYGEDYRIHPQFLDTNEGLTWLLVRHAYAKQMIALLLALRDSDGVNPIFSMGW